MPGPVCVKVFNSRYEAEVARKILPKDLLDDKTRFFVKIGNHFHSVSVNEIQCFLIRERGTFLKTLNAKTYDIDYSLDQVQKLVDPNTFFRINRNYLIHIDAIQDIYSYSSNRLGVKLKMLDHLDMIVSREKVTDFKKWLDR